MTLRNILLDIICTEFPISVVELIPKVLGHPQYPFERYPTVARGCPHITTMVNILVNQGHLGITGAGNYYRVLTPNPPALREISFETARRYFGMRRSPSCASTGYPIFMSSAHGGGWRLYRYIEPHRSGMVGNEGRKRELVARVTGVPEDAISGSYWTDPSNRGKFGKR